MTSVAKGIWIALANTVVIAAALTLELRIREGAVMMVIVLSALVPAVFLGGVLGKLGEVTAGLPSVWRLVLLAVPACGLVIVLADQFALTHFVPHACIPTVAAASILERVTRKPKLLPTAAVSRRVGSADHG
jgi:hypothetical protein